MRLLKKTFFILTLFLTFSWLNLGTSFGQTALETEAVQQYQQGVALMEKGAFDKALPLFEEAIQLDADFAGAHYAAAVCWARKETPNPEKASQAYRKAVALGFQPNEWLENYIDQIDP